MIVYGVPPTPPATVNVQEKSPLAAGLMAHVTGEEMTGEPLTDTEVSKDEKPVPTTVNDAPTGPWSGVRVMLSISKAAEAVSAGEAVSLAVIV